MRRLGKYEAAIRENEVDETVLPGLTAADLKASWLLRDEQGCETARSAVFPAVPAGTKAESGRLTRNGHTAPWTKLGSVISRSISAHSIRPRTACCASWSNWTARLCYVSIRISASCTGAPRS